MIKLEAMKDKIMHLAKKMVETALERQASEYDLDCAESADYIAAGVAAEDAEDALRAALDDIDLPYDHMGERLHKDPYHKMH